MKKFIGDKKFYKMLFAVVIPIVLQMFITQFVSLVDNLMIGQVGGSEMTGVSLANQLLFIFNLGVFGCMAGGTIFATQYFGAKDKRGYQEAFRFKWFLAIILFIISTVVFLVFDDQLLSFFISNSSDDVTDPLVVLESGKTYLFVMLLGNFPFIIKEIYSTSLREMKETFVPMISGIIAIFVNMVFNYLLIFGKFGFPELGVKGAAIATVLSRFVEMFIVVIYSYVKIKKYDYFKGVYSKLISLKSIKMFIPKTIILVFNEIFWSLGLTLILSAYSKRGLDAVAALNICNTVNNVFLTIGTSFGNAASIILGIHLGANEISKAKENSYKILGFAFLTSVVFALLMVLCAFFIPNIYNVSDSIKESAKMLIIIGALFIPIATINCVLYFILRSGGKVLITILFDSVFIFLFRMPLAIVLASFTNLDLLTLFFIITAVDALKTLPGYILVNKGIWLNVIV